MKKKGKEFLLLITALIWGIAFVAQSEGGDAVGPYTFNFVRCVIGAAVLCPVIALLDKLGLTKTSKQKDISPVDKKKQKKILLVGGLFCGIALAVATNLQQLGITLGTSAGKAGFITACYILIVPIMGLFLKKKCPFTVWIGVALALVGLYLLCMEGSFSLAVPDVLLILCAFMFSVQILVIDHYAPLVDGIRLSQLQFLVAGILSAIPMFIVDIGQNPGGIKAWAAAFTVASAWIPILYAGVFSCGVAYTLQIIGQEGANPTIASLLMSFESVFSVLAGWIILKQQLGVRALIGCLLIFVAVILAQIPLPEKKKKQR